ncbi:MULTISPECIES: FeoA family protein [Flagellimonas]|uniref:Ferrous iron transport protein A n=1 Tax=Flagellimonas hadalis TaxID=2597517 RepID=A0A5N5ISU7_9FLAO|nr:FeoA domain-containing protein [Allomuricauda hadalis]KAB5490950.1 ferrous iron transport protein A [Allomuricauda hadalis]RUA16911.1 MAG: ferrous iron transport protein A [Flavobacteriia bacterium]
MVATVIDLAFGQKGIIKDFSEHVLPIKLLELGCLPGNSVELVQIAPLKDPIYINLNGSHIAIRRSLAQLIELDIVEETQAP